MAAAEEGLPQPCLLALPDFLLHSILDYLVDAADLAAAAAACSALRALAAGAARPHIARVNLSTWSPALPGCLRWTVAHCPQLRELDLSGASACQGGDLLPLAQLTSLTSLSLAGLWRVTGSSTGGSGGGGGGGGRAARRRSGGGGGAPPLDVLSAILAANPGMAALDLAGTSVPVGAQLGLALRELTAPVPRVVRRAFGLQRLRLAGCPRAGGAGQEVALGRVLVECPALVSLDVAGCRWLTAECLPDAGHAAWAAMVTALPLRRASFAGCEALGGIGWLVGCWEHLLCLDLSGTAVEDGDVEALAAGCPRLQSLDLGGCCRIRGAALLALAGDECVAVQLGRLGRLGVSDLAWVGPQHLAPLLRQLGACAEAPLCLDLASCGGLADAALAQLVQAVAQRRSRGAIRELRLAGSSRLTAAALLELAEAAAGGGCGESDGTPLLQGLEALDVSHVLCLGSKGGGGGGGGPSAAAATAQRALAALLTAAGASLRRIALDGCCLAGGLLPLLARRCPGVEQLSLVGATGVGDADLAALSTLRNLRDLAVGGSSLAWHERALTGLRGLTRLRIARRPFLTDAQLAPLLARNRGTLLQLELAGCASLTDAALAPLLTGQAREEVEVETTEDEEQRQGTPAQEHQAAPEQPRQVQGGQAAAGQQQAAPPPAPPLQHLQLICCDRLTGGGLRQLGRLRSLRLGGCPAVTEGALQAAAICLTRLSLLELPSHVRPTSLPVAPAGAASHLRGLQLLGGLEGSPGGGRRGGRR